MTGYQSAGLRLACLCLTTQFQVSSIHHWTSVQDTQYWITSALLTEHRSKKLGCLCEESWMMNIEHDDDSLVYKWRLFTLTTLVNCYQSVRYWRQLAADDWWWYLAWWSNMHPCHHTHPPLCPSASLGTMTPALVCRCRVRKLWPSTCVGARLSWPPELSSLALTAASSLLLWIFSELCWSVMAGAAVDAAMSAVSPSSRPSYLKSYPYLFVRETDQTDYFCTICEESLKEDQLQSHLFETHSAENLQVKYSQNSSSYSSHLCL